MKKRKVGQFIVFGLISLVIAIFLGQQVFAQNNVPNISGQWTIVSQTYNLGQNCEVINYRQTEYRSPITISQNGERITLSGEWPSYNRLTVGSISQNQIRVRSSAYPNEFVGTIDSSGNTITITTLCQGRSAGYPMYFRRNNPIQANRPSPTPNRPSPTPNRPSPTPSSSPASNNQSQAEIINAHNRWRSQVNSPPLSWSNDLARVAQDWADQLSRSGGNISHRPNNSYGENIYWAAGGGLSGTDAVDSWGSEIRYFKNGNFPDVSTTGRWSDVGHYTQIIWATTTQVGCGSAQTGNQIIWVCNYNPPGNYQGRNPLSR